ncbi:hypothetical protein [Streptomyces mirabilis]|jgi:hypothetical protein|uniref:Uncharacterized protein n=1 Tax=Streptomyces mirabilis TaxID=68239 RepID=A0A1I2X071_9ACTN|nr:hypothetical protein [Streptomyces mirabilis]SFH06915.1 hypothetical protein SAMN02787118_14159 [Streptomyces mirabilis]
MATSSQRQVIWTSLGTGGRGPGSRRRRGLIIAVGVVVLLIAAIALATRSSQSKHAADDLLAPEISHSHGGAQSAAAKMASALGSETMFNPETGTACCRSSPSRTGATTADATGLTLFATVRRADEPG